MLDIIKCVKSGGVVVFPTDTLFALSCDATNDFAVKRVFEIKGRELNKPLPIFVSGIEMASQYIEMNEDARSLAKEFWPGKLTIIGKSKAGRKLSKAINNGTDAVAVRVPECKVALEIIKALDVPIVGTSANISGDDDSGSIKLIKEKFGSQVDYYLAGDIDSNAMPSTIVDSTSGKIEIARSGAIPVSKISKVLF